MNNRIKHWSLISVVAGLILLLTGCYAENVDKVNIHFPNGGLLENENMYIRYDDGSTVLVDKGASSVTDSIYTYTVATQRAKKVIGYFVEGASEGINYNWVPPLSDYPTTSNTGSLISLDINIHLDPIYFKKPTHAVSYAKVSLADATMGQIFLYDAHDTPINPYLESVDLYVKTGNDDIFFFNDSTSTVTNSVYQFVSGATYVPFRSKTDKVGEYTLPQLKLTAYSGTSTQPIPIYSYDYVPQLDSNHDGIVDIEDVVSFAKNPTDADENDVIDRNDIQFVLSRIEQQTLRTVNVEELFPAPPSITVDSVMQ